MTPTREKLRVYGREPGCFYMTEKTLNSDDAQRELSTKCGAIVENFIWQQKFKIVD